MIKLVLKNGFYYKGVILEEDSINLVLKDFKGNIVEITKDQIAVRLTLNDS